MPRFIRSTSLRLPKDEIDRHTTWLEIFFDLVFAVIVVQLSERASDHLTVGGIFQCAALFIPSLWTWASYTVFAARFDNNDAIHWVMTFIIMFAGAIMAIQIPTALENGGTGFSIGFLIGQFSLLLLYTKTLYGNAGPKKITFFYIIAFGLGGICWIISLFFQPPLKFTFWILGMFIYLMTPWIGRKRVLSKAPLDTKYIPERFGSFTIIILGQIIASVVFGLQSARWDPSSVLIGSLAFVLAILIWSLYYRFTQIADYKCTLGSGQPYIYTHIPLIISLMILGICAQELISNKQISQSIKITFCCSSIIYLISFYLLQRITIPQFKMRGIFYFVGVIVILSLFFLYLLPPLFIMSGMVIIFTILLALQFRLEPKIFCRR